MTNSCINPASILLSVLDAPDSESWLEIQDLDKEELGNQVCGPA